MNFQKNRYGLSQCSLVVSATLVLCAGAANAGNRPIDASRIAAAKVAAAKVEAAVASPAGASAGGQCLASSGYKAALETYASCKTTCANGFTITEGAVSASGCVVGGNLNYTCLTTYISNQCATTTCAADHTRAEAIVEGCKKAVASEQAHANACAADKASIAADVKARSAAASELAAAKARLEAAQLDFDRAVSATKASEDKYVTADKCGALPAEATK